MASKPLTNSQCVSRSRAKAVAAGARRVGPVLLHDADAIRALDSLHAEHGSIRAALEHALRAHAKKA